MSVEMAFFNALNKAMVDLCFALIRQESTEKDETRIIDIAKEAGFRITVFSMFPKTNVRLSNVSDIGDTVSFLNRSVSSDGLTAEVFVLFHKGQTTEAKMGNLYREELTDNSDKASIALSFKQDN